MIEQIVKSKFIPPQLNYQLWENKQLKKKYDQMNDCEVTIVNGGLGCGKTTSLANYLHRYQEDNFYWYKVRQESMKVEEFWANIINLFRFNDPQLADQLSFLLTKLQTQDVELEKVITALINQLMEFKDQTVYVVIDDFYLVRDNDQILASLDQFIELLPAKIHLIIVSRGEVELPRFFMWQVKNKLLLITGEEFLLTASQIEDLFLEQYDLLLTREEANQIKQATEGWLIAIDIAANHLSQGQELSTVLTNLNETFGVVFDYINYEFIADLESKKPLIKEFFLKSSLLRQVDVNVCNKLLNINNSQQIIEQLINKGILIHKVAPDTYCYNNLYQHFLQVEADRLYDCQQLHRKIKEICLQQGKEAEAVYHCLQLEDEQELAELILTKGESWLGEEKFAVLQKTLQALSPEVMSRYPVLFLYQGDLYFNQEQFHQAVASYKEAEEIFQVQQDVGQLLETYFRLLRLFSFFSSNQVIEYVEKLASYQSELSLPQKKKLQQFQVVKKLVQGELKSAAQLLEQAEFSEDVYYELKANLVYRQGNLQQAQQIITEKVEKADDFYDYTLYDTIIQPLLIRLARGNRHQALEYIWTTFTDNNEMVKQLADYHLLEFKQIFNLCGDMKNVKEEYLDFKAHSQDCPFGISWYKIKNFLYLAAWEAYYGDLEAGLEYSEQGLKLACQRNDKYAQGLFYLVIGLNYLLADQLENSYHYFKLAAIINKRVGNKLYWAVSLLGQVLIAYRQEVEDKFVELITKFLQVCQENSYGQIIFNNLSTVILDSSRLLPVLLTAKEKNIKPEYINNLLADLSLSDINRHPGYLLRIRGFGDLKICRNKEEITKEDWKRKKARKLFKFFLVNYGQMIDKEKIYNVFWPEKDPKSAQHNFNVVLSSLNKVLEPNRGSRKETFFIVKDGSEYGLVREESCFYDVAAFEKMVEKGQQAAEEELKINYYQQAIQLYSDDFLVEDKYQDWIINERERLQQLFLETANDLVEYYYNEEQYQAVLDLTDRILDIDKYIEQAYLYKMMSYNQLNRRSEAVKTYLRCRQTLKQELNIEPNPRLQRYYQYMTV